jgi:hypothetical protein
MGLNNKAVERFQPGCNDPQASVSFAGLCFVMRALHDVKSSPRRGHFTQWAFAQIVKALMHEQFSAASQGCGAHSGAPVESRQVAVATLRAAV